MPMSSSPVYIRFTMSIHQLPVYGGGYAAPPTYGLYAAPPPAPATEPPQLVCRDLYETVCNTSVLGMVEGGHGHMFH